MPNPAGAPIPQALSGRGFGQFVKVEGVVCHDRVNAPWVLDASVAAAAFLVHFEQQLVPTLGRSDIVIMDISGSHMTDLLFFPPCSPDPSEQVFAKLKHWLRDARPRCRETLRHSVGDILNNSNPKNV